MGVKRCEDELGLGSGSGSESGSGLGSWSGPGLVEVVVDWEGWVGRAERLCSEGKDKTEENDTWLINGEKVGLGDEGAVEVEFEV